MCNGMGGNDTAGMALLLHLLLSRFIESVHRYMRYLELHLKLIVSVDRVLLYQLGLFLNYEI